jgi:hypothetical protein
MCKISTMLMDGCRYRGTIVRIGNRGHRFDPFGVMRRCDGRLQPTEQANNDMRFQGFKANLLAAIRLSSDPETSTYVEDIWADKTAIRERILALNDAAHLPGLAQVQALCA